MVKDKMTRRRFVSSMMKTGVFLPFTGKERIEVMKGQGQVNRPLIVTSKTNRAVKEKITTNLEKLLSKELERFPIIIPIILRM